MATRSDYGMVLMKDDMPEYRAWKSMRRRCNNVHTKDYPLYGARGIRVCDRWNDFAAFLADMGNRPEGFSLERIDTNGNYEPANCKWASSIEQNNNRRSNRWITFDGETKTIAQWAKHLGVNYFTLQSRITKRGMPVEAALVSVRYKTGPKPS